MVEQKRIFLGHASEDKSRVRELYHQLKARGFSPWLDAVDLMPGQNWRIEIPNAIKSAGVFLACLSKSSVEKQSYVQREYRYALSAYADRQPGSIYMIPVRLDDCEVPDLRLPELELNLRDLHWVDLFEPDGFERLFQSISVSLETSPPKPVEPEDPPGAPTEEAFLKDLRRRYIEAGRAADLAELKHELEAFLSDSGGSAEVRSFRDQLEQAYERQRSIETEMLRERVSQPVAPPSPAARRLNPTIKAAWIGAAAVIVAGIFTSPWLADLLRSKGQPVPVHDTVELPETERQPFESFRDCARDLCPEMVLLPAGTFMMGSPDSEEGRDDDEGPQHEVTITQPFAIGKYEVTFEEYDRFAEATSRDRPDDRGWGRGKRPVINVSWDDSDAYCAWLGEGYRLPTEAEWEYAARAGTVTRYSFGDDITAEQANFAGVLGKTAEVGSFPKNPWGLHGMHGNVLEWVSDRNRDYSSASVTDPQGPATGTHRVARGGSWNVIARFVRSAYRVAREPGDRRDALGFRCAGVQGS